jgi:hypothetical protein
MSNWHKEALVEASLHSPYQLSIHILTTLIRVKMSKKFVTALTEKRPKSVSIFRCRRESARTAALAKSRAGTANSTTTLTLKAPIIAKAVNPPHAIHSTPPHHGECCSLSRITALKPASPKSRLRSTPEQVTAREKHWAY